MILNKTFTFRPTVPPCRRVIYIFIFFFICILIFSCTKRDVNYENTEVYEVETPLPDPFWEQAAVIAASLDDRLLAAQVLISGIDGQGSLPYHMREFLREVPPGGIMLFRNNLNASNDSIRSLITESRDLIFAGSGITPFFAADIEGGTVNRVRGNRELPAASALPAAVSYWEIFQNQGKNATLEKIENDAAAAAAEIAALGINMNFAPIAEHLNDDNRIFLQSRSYGSDPLFTAEAAAAFITGMHSNGVLCVVKHFPGSAGVDPHYSASVFDVNLTSFNELISPFEHLLKNSNLNEVKAVMIAHTLVPVIDNKIASLSSVFMNDVLRTQMRFTGLIIADDFSMAAAGDSNPEQAAILSIAAGSDMVLVWQKDLISTHSAFLSALQDGRLPRELLVEAVTRIIYNKIILTQITQRSTHSVAEFTK